MLNNINELTRKNYTLAEIGDACRSFRLQHGYTQKDISNDIYYTQQAISRFEHGHLDNCRVLLWYIVHGFKIEDYIKE